MKCIVTGGAGFIGSHIAERLIKDGKEVVIIDDLSAGKESNIPEGARFIKANVINIASYQNELNDTWAVFHNAASKKNICEYDPDYDLAVNAGGTHSLVRACQKAGVSHFIHASTGSVYGEVDGVITEETPTNPVSFYGVSKLAGEKYVSLYNGKGMNITILRYFHVYGERQEDDPKLGGVIAVFKRQAAEGGPITLHGDGSQKRLFTHVGDVVEANIKCTQIRHDNGEVYNCASDRRFSVMYVAGKVIRGAGHPVLIDYGPSLPGDIYNFEIDNSKIKEELRMEFRPFKI